MTGVDGSVSMDNVNRAAWCRGDTVRWFAKLEGWTDPGERAALEAVAEACRGRPILDLGVGAGRTVPLLRAISDDYTAVDYTPQLVAACRAKYPDVRILEGDARDLAAFADSTFELVVFSFNGIDAVDEAGRMRILHEVYRVLRPGGRFLFSTHNRQGPGHGEGLRFGLYRTRNPFKLGWRLLKVLAMAPLTVYNRRRYSRLNRIGDDHSIMNAAAHNHGIVIHYITLHAQRRQLHELGFATDVAAYASADGRLLNEGEDLGQVPWFHLIARKPQSAT